MVTRCLNVSRVVLSRRFVQSQPHRVVRACRRAESDRVVQLLGVISFGLCTSDPSACCQRGQELLHAGESDTSSLGPRSLDSVSVSVSVSVSPLASLFQRCADFCRLELLARCQ